VEAPVPNVTKLEESLGGLAKPSNHELVLRYPGGAAMRAAAVQRILTRLSRAYGPVPPPRLEEPVSCLIGTILAQATNDVLAERAYRSLRGRLRSWEAVLAAPRREVEDAIRVSGLAAQKARAIQAFLAHLMATRRRMSLRDLRRADLDVDAALTELSSVPGVGIKTAAITLMFGARVSLCAVDTHIVRVLRRLAIVPPSASPERAFRILRPLVPRGRGVELHMQLIRFGRTTCRALRPRCRECALRRTCPYPEKAA
jgi:endonuclease III